jgi:6-phosphogluconolactonase
VTSGWTSVRIALLIGAYTGRLPHVDGRADGIQSTLLADDGFEPVEPAATASNPSWLTVDRSGSRVYAVEENAGTEAQGTVVSFRRDLSTGQLSAPRRRPSGGSGPAHAALDATQRWVVTANYGSGDVAVHDVTPDGGIGEITDSVRHLGSGIDPDRQRGAHPHQIVVDPVTRALAVPDLGIDAVVFHALAGGRLTERDSERVQLPPGTGPRHIAFHPDGAHLFILGELDGSLRVLRRDRHMFHEGDTVSLGGRRAAAAEIVVTDDGGTVLASTRGASPEIIAFAFDRESSRLTMITRAAAPDVPRSMCLARGDSVLLVGGQKSHDVVAYRLDMATRRLSRIASVRAASPSCIVVVDATTVSRPTALASTGGLP